MVSHDYTDFSSAKSYVIDEIYDSGKIKIEATNRDFLEKVSTVFLQEVTFCCLPSCFKGLNLVLRVKCNFFTWIFLFTLPSSQKNHQETSIDILDLDVFHPHCRLPPAHHSTLLTSIFFHHTLKVQKKLDFEIKHLGNIWLKAKNCNSLKKDCKVLMLCVCSSGLMPTIILQEVRKSSVLVKI